MSAEIDIPIIENLAVEKLQPNDYNPNTMTPTEFNELVTEVKHLASLPKPVVVRPNGHGYIIIDGYHGWLAAKEAGLSQVPCEVLDIDEFEAMRQTYKRNQHGTHNPVLQGKMFQRMMGSSGLSQRAFAEMINISEGTVRNSLLYAKADEVRNGYAFEKLTIRQIREYLSLPVEIGNIWLDAGANIETLDKAFVIDVSASVLKKEKVTLGKDWLQGIVDNQLTSGIWTRLFEWSLRNVLELLEWTRKYPARHLQVLVPYIRAVAELGYTKSVMKLLPCELTQDKELVIPISSEKWKDILRECSEREKGKGGISQDLIAASVRLALKEVGVSADDMTDPRTIEMMNIVNDGPDFIRDANLDLWVKRDLVIAGGNGDWPEDMLLEAKRLATAAIEAGHPLQVLPLLNTILENMLLEKKQKEGDIMFSSREETIKKLVERFKANFHIFRTGKVDGRPAYEVLEERLAQVDTAELLLFASFLLGYRSGPVLWIQALKGEFNPSADG